MTNDAPSVSDAIDKLVDQSVNDVRADEDAAAQAAQQQWDEAQGIYGDLGVAALDRSTSVAHQLGDAIRPYIKSFGAGLVLGGLFAAGLDAVREVRRTG